MSKEIEKEKTLERSLKKCVESGLNGWSLKIPSVHLTGLPDRLNLLPGGRIFFAEIKTTGKPARKIQLWMHAKLRALGFDVYLIDCTEHIEEIKAKYAN